MAEELVQITQDPQVSAADRIKAAKILLDTADIEAHLTAAAAPLKPPLAWFEMPEADAPTPMTYQDDGQVFGHLALWESCHRGFMGGAYTECVRPPSSRTDYGQFHLGMIKTKEGTDVPIGKITYETDHAPLTADVVAASRHYDNSGSVGAFVRARNGRLGIWLSGALRSDLPAGGLVSLRANPLSGDWRTLNHNLELVASLAVPVPGFPIPQSQLALAAAADGGLEVSALILPSFTAEDLEEEETLVAAGYSSNQKRKRAMLRKRVVAAIPQEYEDGFTAAVFTAKQRQRLAKSGAAMSDGSFPIRNCTDLMNARRAIGRASQGKREAVRAHIAKRAKVLGCSTGN